MQKQELLNRLQSDPSPGDAEMTVQAGGKRWAIENIGQGQEAIGAGRKGGEVVLHATETQGLGQGGGSPTQQQGQTTRRT